MNLNFESCITAAKSLETLLEVRFAATGKGMHQKISSVEDRLTAMQIRCLRAVATLRNKLIHDGNFDVGEMPDDYLQLCEELIGILDASAGRTSQINPPATSDKTFTDSFDSFSKTGIHGSIERTSKNSGEGSSSKDLVTVKYLASELGVNTDRLIARLYASGIEVSDENDHLTEDDKLQLLRHLRKLQN